MAIDDNGIMLFQNAKIQDLNVIHNLHRRASYRILVVSECKDTRFECNSQHCIKAKALAAVVSECKDTRFECNSQLAIFRYVATFSCFRMQRYKI